MPVFSSSMLKTPKFVFQSHWIEKKKKYKGKKDMQTRGNYCLELAAFQKKQQTA